MFTSNFIKMKIYLILALQVGSLKLSKSSSNNINYWSNVMPRVKFSILDVIIVII